MTRRLLVLALTLRHHGRAAGGDAVPRAVRRRAVERGAAALLPRRRGIGLANGDRRAARLRPQRRGAEGVEGRRRHQARTGRGDAGSRRGRCRDLPPAPSTRSPSHRIRPARLLPSLPAARLALRPFQDRSARLAQTRAGSASPEWRCLPARLRGRRAMYCSRAHGRVRDGRRGDGARGAARPRDAQARARLQAEQARTRRAAGAGPACRARHGRDGARRLRHELAAGGVADLRASTAPARGWQLMAHFNAVRPVPARIGRRAAPSQGGSINWFMGMAQRPLARGRLAFRGMVSLEPFTIPGCGYPDLLASGEQCDGEPIHDRQHPHDLFMELSAQYDAPLARGLRWQLFGGPAAEPALGPVAFPHRVSAMPNPVAPLSHHWLDATHVVFGVVTGGVYGARWKAEASVFNGREPDEHRTDFDFGALDSVSGAAVVLARPRGGAAGLGRPARRSRGGGPWRAARGRDEDDRVRHRPHRRARRAVCGPPPWPGAATPRTGMRPTRSSSSRALTHARSRHLVRPVRSDRQDRPRPRPPARGRRPSPWPSCRAATRGLRGAPRGCAPGIGGALVGQHRAAVARGDLRRARQPGSRVLRDADAPPG